MQDCKMVGVLEIDETITRRLTYDNLDRLDTVLFNNTVSRMEYDTDGNMTRRTSQGVVVFKNASVDSQARPHAVTGAEVNSAMLPDAQTVLYTMHDKVKRIEQGDDYLAIDYGHDRQRIGMSEWIAANQATTHKLYVGSCEFNRGLNREQRLTYISGPLGVFAVYEQLGELYKGGGTESDDSDDSDDGGGDEDSFTGALYYLYRDHLGSVTTITNSSGAVVQELSYDAWGNLRNPYTWSGSFTGTPKFDRGFTGHEHHSHFGLINMNGRMYDPLMCSFLSVDTYVQDPGNALNFNRYAYCLNNPLRYVDPDGEWFLTWGLDYGRRSDGSYGVTGGSLGVNFGFGGFGFHANWANGITVGAYGEIGPHVGNAGLTATFGVDYNFKYQTTTASLSAGYGFSYGIGRAGLGVSGSYTWGLPSGVNPWNANVSASLGVAGSISKFGQMAGLGLSCSYGTQGWGFGGHSYCEMLPLQEKLNRIINYYRAELVDAIGYADPRILVGNDINFIKNKVDAHNSFGDIWDGVEKTWANGLTIKGKGIGMVEFCGGNYVSIDSDIYISKNAIRRIWGGSEFGKRTLFHEWVHAHDYYSGQADYWFRMAGDDNSVMKTRMEEHAHDFVNGYFPNLPPDYYQP